MFIPNSDLRVSCTSRVTITVYGLRRTGQSLSAASITPHTDMSPPHLWMVWNDLENLWHQLLIVGCIAHKSGDSGGKKQHSMVTHRRATQSSVNGQPCSGVPCILLHLYIISPAYSLCPILRWRVDCVCMDVVNTYSEATRGDGVFSCIVCHPSLCSRVSLWTWSLAGIHQATETLLSLFP